MDHLNVDRLITHPRRRWIVTTGTLLSGLLFLLPAVDSFSQERSRYAELSEKLDASRELIDQKDHWQKRLQEQQERLQHLESCSVTEDELNDYRNWVTECVRHNGCQMRRIHVGEPVYRPWMKTNDDPTEDRPPVDAEGETPWMLETRELTISVEGELGHINVLLDELHTTDVLAHSSGVSVRRRDDAASNVGLDLNLVLMNLVRKSAVEL
ncbi:MAG: hypothetical protein ACYTGL_08410 [Planctomycetota bacterium]|jgi:hypothetical protein